MHRKRTFALAAVFLIIALVVPPLLVVLQTNNTIYKYIIPGTNPAQGSPSITITITPQERQSYSIVIITAAVIEVIFIILFVVTIYYGIKHTHPEH